MSQTLPTPRVPQAAGLFHRLHRHSMACPGQLRRSVQQLLPFHVFNQLRLHQLLPLLRPLAFAFAILFASSATLAANKTFSNAAGGDWHTASNWTPAGVPASGDTVTLPAGTGSVTITSANVTVLSLSVGRALSLGTGRTLALISASVNAPITLANTASLTGGTYTINAGGGFIFPATCNLGRLSGITINGDLNIAGGGVSWTNVTLNGSLNVSGSSTTVIAFNGNTTINYPVTSTSTGAVYITQGTAGTLTVAAGTTIAGSNINFSSSCVSSTTALVNNGTIVSNVANQGISISYPMTNNGTVTATAGSVTINGLLTNNGTVNATAGSITIGNSVNPLIGTYVGNNVRFAGTLDLANGTWDLAGRTINLLSGATLQNGRVITEGGGRLTFPAICNYSRLANLMIDGDLNISGGGVRWSNITLNGGLNVTAITPTSIAFEGDTTINFPVSITSAGSTTSLEQATAGTLTISPSRSISGGNFTFGSGCSGVPMTLINNGTITSSIAGLTVLISTSVTFTNNGTLVASSGSISIATNVNPLIGTYTGRNFRYSGSLDLAGGTWDLTGQTVTLQAGALVRNGTLLIDGGSFILPAACAPARFRSLTIQGDLALNGSAITFDQVALSGSLRVDGTANTSIGFVGNAAINFPVTVNGTGIVFFYNEAPGTLTVSPTTVIRGGNIRFGSNCNFSGTTSVINNGLIIAELPGQSIVFDCPVVNNGTLDASIGSIAINNTVTPTAGSFSGNNFTFAGTIDLAGENWNIDGRTINLGQFAVLQNGIISMGSGRIVLPSTQVNSCAYATLRNLVIIGDLTLSGGGVRWNLVTLNGQLNIAGSSVTLIGFENNTTLSFPILIDPASTLVLGMASAGTLTLPAGRSLSAGRLEFNTRCSGSPMTLVNNGTITATEAGQTVIFEQSVTLTNNGRIDATTGSVRIGGNVNPLVGIYAGTNYSYGGSVNLGSGTWDISGRTITLLNGSVLTNGTINNFGTGNIVGPDAGCDYARFSNIAVNGTLGISRGQFRWTNVAVAGGLTITGSGRTAILFNGNTNINFPIVASGGGTVYLGHETAGTLTISQGVTISGGNVSFSGFCVGMTSSIINNGTIICSGQGQTLSIAYPIVNNGLIVADTGAVSISSTLSNNGTIESRAGSVTISASLNPLNGVYLGPSFSFGGILDLNGATWDITGRTITLTGAAAIQNGTLITGNGTLSFSPTCTASRLANLTINGNLNMAGGVVRWSNLTLNGGVSFTGTSPTIVGFEGSSFLLDFPITFAAGSSAYLAMASGGTLTIPATRTISGGTWGFGSGCFNTAMTVVNYGTLVASTQGETLFFGATTTLMNNGTVDAVTGSVRFLGTANPLLGSFTGTNFIYAGTVELSGGSWNIGGRTITLWENATIQNGSIQISNGRLSFPSTSFANCNSVVRLSNLAVIGDLNIADASLRLSAVSITGSVNVTGFYDTFLRFVGNSTISFPINVSSTGITYLSQSGTGTLTVASGVTVSGGNIRFNGYCSTSSTALINNGVIECNIPGRSIRIDYPYSGSGLLWGSVVLNNFALTAPFATATSANNASFTGTRTPPDNAPPTAFAFRSFDLQPASSFTLGANETLNLSSGQGTLRIGLGSVFYGNGTILGNILSRGTLVLPTTRLAAINNTSGGIIRVAITPPALPPTPIDPIVITPTSPPNVAPSTLLQIGGSGLGGGTGGGQGGGGGSGGGSFYRLSASSLTVRGGITWDGRLDITGSYTQSSSGFARLFIAGSAQGETYSFLNIGQAASLAGTLQVILQPELFEATPSVGDTFDVLTAAGGITLPTPPAALQIQSLMTAAGAARLGLLLPAYSSGLVGDPNQLVSLPDNILSSSISPDGRTLRLTLTAPICGPLTSPSPVATCVGGTASFSVLTAGAGPFALQWQAQAAGGTAWSPVSDGSTPGIGTIGGSTTDTLVISNIDPAAASIAFRCAITSPCGAAFTTPVNLTTNARCSLADLVGTEGGPVVCGDSTVDGSDFVAFINSFAIGNPNTSPLADVAGGGPDGLSPDGVIDGTDFVAFINAFALGC